MDLPNTLQLIANVVLFLLAVDVLRTMRRHSPQIRGAVFLLVAVVAAFGILAAVSAASDAEANALLAVATAALMFVGCRPIRRIT